jgi:sugar phosphate isomerase/epimerase
LIHIDSFTETGGRYLIRLGVNTVLFKAFTFAEAAEAIRLAGYDGVEISAIEGMREHLDVKNYKQTQNELKSVMENNGLDFLSAEVASLDRERLERAFEACAALGIPVVNVGPGGKSSEPGSLEQSVEILGDRAELASQYGVTLCCKAHVGCAVFDTPTTLAMINGVKNCFFGVDMDPSHIWRAGEDPAEALPKVIQNVKHIHIRDCKGREASPGLPKDQACGRGDVDLFGYFKAMVDAGYDGPVCLEVIGPEQTMTEAAVIAAESYGYMNAVLKALGVR